VVITVVITVVIGVVSPFRKKADTILRRGHSQTENRKSVTVKKERKRESAAVDNTKWTETGSTFFIYRSVSFSPCSLHHYYLLFLSS